MIETSIIHNIKKSAAGQHWQRIGIKHHHGIVLPLFSLKSFLSCGIGEYPDLLPLIPWVRSIGFDVIQLLPLNDTGRESSPYNALSAFALNPIHLGLHQLPFSPEVPNCSSLNQRKKINYPEVYAFKDSFLRQYNAKYGDQLKEKADYQSFKNKAAFWLFDYARYKSFKVLQNWKPWEEWFPILRDFPQSLESELSDQVVKEMDYQILLQYLCFHQLESVKQSADAHGVYIKGDIPILINRDSSDVWRYRQLFLLEFSAGAPPDMYAKEGQKWGFPLYSWEQMAIKSYQWWCERLHTASTCYHLYRLDHIVGFFRIWAIPLALAPQLGHYIPENQDEWIPHGKQLMQVMLDASGMLPIGEDLGTIPPEVRTCLRSLGICGTKVVRWERSWNTDKQYIDPKNYPPESMTTVSTHDSETLAEWWKNQTNEAMDYAAWHGWTYTPELKRDLREKIIYESHHSGSLFHINLLQEYLALIPGMTWENIDDERINIPGTISDRNWTYRFRPFIEEIIANPDLQAAMRDVIRV